MEWLLDNWAAIALAALTFADVLVSFNPNWDGKGLGYIRAIVNALADTSKKKKKKASE